MSPPHDWLKSPGPSPEASAEAEGTGQARGGEAGAERAGGGEAGAERAGAERAGAERAGAEGPGAEGAGAEDGDLAQADGAQVKADVGGDKKGDGGSASAESDPVGEANSAGAATSGEASAAGETDQSAAAESQSGATNGERGHGGWSGRAVGPLSGLLPGAVELNADDLPVEPAASEVAVGYAKSVRSAAGDYQSAEAVVAADDQPAPTVEDAGAAGAFAGDASPAAQRNQVVEVTEEPEPSPSATDDRWRAVLVGFVDDPRGSVEAARVLIDEDIATHLALLARRKEAMHAAWDASTNADTEALRVTLVSYRDLRKRLADVLDALTP